MYLSPRKKLFVDTASEMFGNGSIISKAMMKEAADKCGVPLPYWMQKQCKVGYNQFKLPSEGAPAAPAVVSEDASAVVNLVATNMNEQNLVPALFEGFVPWGNFKLIEKVVKSGMFYPMFITGLSGNGKTLMVEQV